VGILRELLPEGLDGGVSTLPLSYKPWGVRELSGIVHNLARVAAALVRIHREDGKLIHLDIEPEPYGLVENTSEVIDFYERRLLPEGAAMLARELGTGEGEARALLLEHIQICFDCCHFAVEYEDPVQSLERLDKSGIRVGRIQLSSALQVAHTGDENQADALAPFAESTYLHQVIARCEHGLQRYPDLPEALSRRPECPEWRIHFHVPLFTKSYNEFQSTQDYVRNVMEFASRNRCTRHLEIETYTWDVLPPDLKIDLLDSIEREYRWVLGERCKEPPFST
jgi:hypothetical protein